MKKNHILEGIAPDILYYLLLIISIVLAGCADSTEGQQENATESGRIALNIAWKTQSEDSGDIQNADGTLNCENSEIDVIYAAVFDSEGRFLGDSGSQGWDCNLHSGVIEGIEAGEGRKIVIKAYDKDGVIIFRGEQHDITVSPGQTVTPEPVEAYIFSPELTDPESNSTVTLGEFSLEWNAVVGAFEYEIAISTTIDFSQAIESRTTIETSYLPSSLSSGLVYYWRVRAIDGDGNAGSWSDIDSFYVDETRNSSPVLSTSIGSMTVNEGDLLSFVIEASDPDNDTLNFSFDPALPAGALFDSSSQTIKWTPAYTQAGTYKIKVIIIDDGTPNISISDTFTIVVNNVNAPPNANAGADQSGMNGDLITLNGSSSSDVDGDVLTYAWSIISQPAGSAAVLSSTTAANPSFTIDVSGDYILQLIVNDGIVSSAPDTITVSTDNSAPVANAGPDQSGMNGDLITLNGSSSSDVDGDVLTYAWSITSQPAGSTALLSSTTVANPSFTIDVSGDYIFQLIVNDGIVSSVPDTITVSTDNSAPVANAGPDQSGMNGDLITLNGSGSSDVDGDALTYAWSITSQPAGSTAVLSSTTAANPTFTIDVSGDYIFQLIVNDGTVSSDPVTVTVSTDNSAPVADAGPDQSGFNGETITLNGSGSSDVDGDVLTYAWSMTSRPEDSTAVLSSSTAVNPSFTIDVSGNYNLQLIVNDGTVSSDPVTVTVSTDNSAPAADAGPDQSGYNGETITLDGSSSSDVDGDVLTYAWSITSQPPGSTAVLSSTTAANPTFTIDVSGDYIFQLIVNDGMVSSAPDTITVSTDNSAPVADAGTDQIAIVGNLVVLDGSSSMDADEDPLTYNWSFSSVPPGSGAVLLNTGTANPSFVVDLAGTYVVQLIVNDGIIGSNPDSISIDAN